MLKLTFMGLVLFFFVTVPLVFPGDEVRIRAIETELARLKKLVSQYGGDEQIRRALVPLEEILKERVLASDPKAGYFRLGDHAFQKSISLRSMQVWDYTGLPKEDGHDNPVRAIIDFDRKLRHLGVQLILVPVPARIEVYADLFGAELPEGLPISPSRLNAMIQLLEADVEVLDLLPTLNAARKNSQHAVYEMHGHHASGLGVRLAGELVAARLDHLVLKGCDKSNFKTQIRMSTEWVDRSQPMTAWQVKYADDRNYETVADSPIVVIGDSHANAYKSASFSSHIARASGLAVTDLSTSSGGTVAHRQLGRSGAQSLGGRKVVIWIVTGAALSPRLWPLAEIPEKMSIPGMIMMGHSKQAISIVKAMSKGEIEALDLDEKELVQLGRNLASVGKLQLARAALEVNLLVHPDLAGPYGSMGEFFARALQDRANAIKFFKMSLEREPSEEVRANSELWLKRLGADRDGNRPKLTRDVMEALTGEYHIVPDLIVFVTHRQEKLYLELKDRFSDLEMLPVSETHFNTSMGIELKFELVEEGMKIIGTIGANTVEGYRVATTINRKPGR